MIPSGLPSPQAQAKPLSQALNFKQGFMGIYDVRQLCPCSPTEIV